MKRDKFLTVLLTALPVFSFAKELSFFSSKRKNDKKGFVIKSDESRYNGIQIESKNSFLHCKISSTDTDKKLFIQTSTPIILKDIGGPPPHVHEYEDEIIYIVSGEFTVHINGEDFGMKTGDTAFIPKGTLHTVINPVENNPGTLMTIFQPAPKKVEDFFGYISKYGAIPADIVPEGW